MSELAQPKKVKVKAKANKEVRSTITLIISAVLLLAATYLWTTRTSNEVATRSVAGDEHIYDIILRAIARDDADAAIEIDLKGNVVWANEVALNLFDLKAGDNLSKIMPDDEDAAVHHEKFKAASEQHERGNGTTKTNIHCKAITKTGEVVPIRVQAWTIKGGGMAFIRIRPNEESN